MKSRRKFSKDFKQEAVTRLNGGQSVAEVARAWARHPVLGRMYLPAYRAGTNKVAELRRRFPPDKLLPVLYGCSGLVDVTTIEPMLPSVHGRAS